VAGIDGETLLMQLDRIGIAVSSGSACASGKNEASHVLMAMGVDADTARGAIRISLGKDTTESDVDFLLAELGKQIKWVQKAGQAAGW
jgi:cysteine desulfurase